MVAAPKTSGAIAEGDPLTLSRASANQPFRELIPHPDHPKIAGISNDTPESWTQRKIDTVPPVAWLCDQFSRKRTQPFKGVTTDGTLIDGLYQRVTDASLAAPTEAMREAADAVVALLSEEQRKATLFEFGCAEQRIWTNPELYINPGGVRLDADGVTQELRDAIDRLVKGSTSGEGYAKIWGCRRTNHFLGELVNGLGVLNENSYNFRLFGTPSLTEPWGYSFFGHHMAVNVSVCGADLSISPTFFGAEPDYIDEGPHKGLRLFSAEEHLPLKLMQSLAPELQKKAQLYDLMVGDHLPEDKWNPFDERHLGGATRDNRVIPYEGVCVKSFTSEQRDQVLRILAAFQEHLPEGPRRARMAQIERHLDDTYFAWIGSFGDADPYYYRLQSPVALAEFDFHAGIFLTNSLPAKCHIHTLQRQPNGNDYGYAIAKLHASK